MTVIPSDHRHQHHRQNVVIDFIREARKGGLFHEASYPWLDEARRGEWPYRELRWIWLHPVLFAAAVFWPIICVAIVVAVNS